MPNFADLEPEQYLSQVVLPNFMNIVDEKTYSVIIDCNYIVRACTNYSARAMGLESWQEAVGTSFSQHADQELAKKIFKEAYHEKSSSAIHHHAAKIFELQKLVISKGKIVSFIDLLPYNNEFKSYLITYVPLYHQNKQIIGLQSFAIESRFLGFQEHIQNLENKHANPNSNKVKVQEPRSYFTTKNLSSREHEILFLLANGVIQEQIAQILNISRSTVASIIGSQLCVKFGIAGSNTKLLSQAAIQNGYYKFVPPSLWKPCIIILDDGLAEMFEQTD